ARRPLPATGPYMIDSYIHGRRLMLVRNPRFREWSQSAQPAGNPDRIEWEFAAVTRASVGAVNRGRTDVLSAAPPLPGADGFLTRSAPQLHPSPRPAILYLFLTTRRPPFDDVRVRRAVAYAVDRRHVVQLLQGALLAQPSCQMLPPSFPGYRPYCPYTAQAHAAELWRDPDVAAAQRTGRA